MDEQFIRENFPQRLKHYMQIHEKKRNDLVKDLGFKYSTIRDWEKGITIPRMDKAEALARYFNVTTTDLIGEQKAPLSLRTPAEIGDIIRRRREEKGLTTEQLAENAHTTAATIRKWEKGKIDNPRTDAVENLANALDLPTAILRGIPLSEEEIQKQKLFTKLNEILSGITLTDETIQTILTYVEFVTKKK